MVTDERVTMATMTNNKDAARILLLDGAEKSNKTSRQISLRWKSPYCYIPLCLLLVIVICLLLVVWFRKSDNVGESYNYVLKESGIHTNNNDCSSLECASYMALAKRLMNQSIDPCQDFYEYACGNFSNVFPLPEGNNQTWGRSNVVELSIIAKLASILQQNKSSLFEWEAHQKVKTVYDACVHNRGQGRTAFRRIAMEMGGFSNETHPPFADSFAMLHQYNTDALFKVRVDIILNVVKEDSRNYAVLVEPGSHSLIGFLGSNPLKTPPIHYEKKYAESLLRIAKVATNGESVVANMSVIYDVIEFERKLAAISRSFDVMANDTNLCFVTFAELEERCPLINWRRNFGVYFADKTSLAVDKVAMNDGDRLYLHRICGLIANYSSTSKGKLILHNYLVLKALQPFHEKIHHHNFVMAMPIKREDLCVIDVSAYLPFAVGSLLEKATLTDATRQKVRSLIGQICAIFKVEIERSQFLSRVAKDALTQIIDTVKFDVGYPEWTHDEDKLNAFYESFLAADNNVGNAVAAFRFQKRQSIQLLGQSTGASDLTIYESPVSVNSHYSIYANEIAIYPSVILPPYYNDAYPDAVNLAGIGTTVAHELSHTFESDEISKDIETDLFLKERTLCVANHFGKSYNFRGMRLRSSSTVEEDVPDISGVKLAYNLFKQQQHCQSYHHPEIGLTSDKLFFVAYAQTHCLSYSAHGLRNLIITSSHTPGPFRVQGTLANVPEFAKVFKCKKSTPMNPNNTCQIW